MKFLENLIFHKGALQMLWGNFVLLSVVKNFRKTVLKHWSTEVSSYSECGKILQ